MILVTYANCKDCEAAKRLLADAGVKYREIDVRKVRDAKLAVKIGKVPAVVTRGSVFEGLEAIRTWIEMRNRKSGRTIRIR